MARSFDIIIIGNGSIAMTLALELAKASSTTRICVIGPKSRSGSASLAAGAMLNAWAEIDIAAHEDPSLESRFLISRNALDMWRHHAEMLTDISGQHIHIGWGTYVISGSQGPIREERTFEYMLQRLKQDGIGHQEISSLDIPFLAPDIKSRPMRVAKVPDGYVDSHCVMKALEIALHQIPVCDLINGVAKQLVIEKSGDKRIRLDNGDDLISKVVVFANGAYAQELIDQIPDLKNSVPRLLFGGGSALDLKFSEYTGIPAALQELDGVVRTLDRGGGCGMHLIPRGNASFYFGASSGVWLQPEPLPQAHAILSLLRGLTTEFHHAFFRATTSVRGQGFRPVTMDTFPLLGESDVSGIWFCNGTKRDGFTCAPFLARELAKAMNGYNSALPLLFRPSRSLISYRKRESAIEAAVDGIIGSEYMNGMILPTYLMAEWPNRHYERIRSIYNRHNINEFGIHPEILHFYESDKLFDVAAHHRDRQ